MSLVTTIKPGDKGADYVKLTVDIKSWLLRNKIKFVARYLVPTSRIGKIITPDEISWLQAHGIAILLNYEGSSNDDLGGSYAGFKNGTWIRGRASELGYPIDVPLFCSVDTDTFSGNLVRNRAYVTAFHAAIAPYPLGLYGDTTIAKLVESHNPVFWRANASSWGKAYPGQVVHIQQGSTISPPGVDPNTALVSFNAWLPHADPVISPVVTRTGVKMLYVYIDPTGLVWIGNGLARRPIYDAAQFDQYLVLSNTGGGPKLITANGLQVRSLNDVARVGTATLDALGIPV